MSNDEPSRKEEGMDTLSNDEDLTLLTESMMSGTQLSKIEKMRDYTQAVKMTQDLFDYEKILSRDDERRKALAIRDILLSRRVPFSLDKEQYLRNKEDDHPLLRQPAYQPPVKELGEVLPPIARPSSRKAAKDRASNLKIAGKSKSSIKRVVPEVSKVKITTFTDLEQSSEEKLLNQKLQVVLEILEQAKSHVNSTKLYVKAAKLFSDLKFYDRSIYCYQQATISCDPERIIDTEYLPETLQYKRKLERMSEMHRKTFLQERAKLRQRLVFEESERQRLRARFSHCQLFYLYSLVPSVQDLWKGFEHLQQSFTLCTNDREHIELLHYYHYQIKALSDLLRGKAEFEYDRQIIQAMAGPIAEAHLNILLELESLDPENPEIQDWLGIRYTEKCDFENAMLHYKKHRDIRTIKPTLQDALDLWKTPVDGETYEERERKKQIAKNTYKHILTQYDEFKDNNIPVHQKAESEERKDFTWFPGCHNEANTIIYTPPPQGWHLQDH